MEATEARKLTEKNASKLEVILEQIKSNAEVGMISVSWYNYVSNEIQQELMKLGYAIRYHEDKSMGTICLIISW